MAKRQGVASQAIEFFAKALRLLVELPGSLIAVRDRGPQTVDFRDQWGNLQVESVDAVIELLVTSRGVGCECSKCGDLDLHSFAALGQLMDECHVARESLRSGFNSDDPSDHIVSHPLTQISVELLICANRPQRQRQFDHRAYPFQHRAYAWSPEQLLG